MITSISQATTTTELSQLVEKIMLDSDLEFNRNETYAESAYRLRKEGQDEMAQFLDNAEARWFELEA